MIIDDDHEHATRGARARARTVIRRKYGETRGVSEISRSYHCGKTRAPANARYDETRAYTTRYLLIKLSDKKNTECCVLGVSLLPNIFPLYIRAAPARFSVEPRRRVLTTRSAGRFASRRFPPGQSLSRKMNRKSDLVRV